MVLLTFLWGFQQVTIKTTQPDISLVMQAALRSIVATLLLLLWARVRGIALFGRDGTLWAGILAGVLFAGEFVFIYAGLGHTNASRMAVFVYLAPALTALGVHLFVPGERLHAGEWAGVLLAFAGIVLAFAEGFASGYSTSVLWLLFWRCGTFVGVCVEFVAAVAWVSELFANPRTPELQNFVGSVH